MQRAPHKDKLGTLQRDKDVGNVDANARASARPISAASGCTKGLASVAECEVGCNLCLCLSQDWTQGPCTHTRFYTREWPCTFQSSPIAVCRYASCLHPYTALDSTGHASRSNIVDTERCRMQEQEQRRGIKRRRMAGHRVTHRACADSEQDAILHRAAVTDCTASVCSLRTHHLHVLTLSFSRIRLSWPCLMTSLPGTRPNVLLQIMVRIFDG